jgi:hypothetical protein
MKSLKRSALLTLTCATLLGVVSFARAQDVIQPPPPAQTKASMHLLFQRSQALFVTADKLCDVDSCHAAVAAAAAKLQDGIDMDSTEHLTGAAKADWHNTFGEQLQTVQVELMNVVQRKQGVQPTAYLPAPAPRKPCLNRVNATYTCDNVFAIATAICSLYTSAGPLGAAAAAICEAATIYGYNQCLNGH